MILRNTTTYAFAVTAANPQQINNNPPGIERQITTGSPMSNQIVTGMLENYGKIRGIAFETGVTWIARPAELQEP
ncbi:unnamed protein product [Lasius platythorax]|uniref:Uncharacterized protein n=1 Tax=Lasius platythorax TaxID=488582 RepID=A0AAV2N526_9HYME